MGSFGHTGFTGTSIWIDPVTNSYVIVLTNAVHPRGSNSGVVSLRSRIASAVAQGLGLTVSEEQELRLARITGYNEAMSARAAGHGAQRLGAHRHRRAGEPRLRRTARAGQRQRPGLRWSPTRPAWTRTAIAPSMCWPRRAASKSPPSSARSTASPEAWTPRRLSDSRDAATGIPVYSVYGDSSAKRHPSLEILNSVDAIVYDIQDIGTRFYTYETTLGYFLEAAAKTGKKIFVLDRPNPINGAYVQGPISDQGRESFTNYGQIPIRHGMTIGELARFYNAERGIHARLTVVADGGLAARRLAGFDWSSLGQSFAQHAQPDRSRSLSRRRHSGGNQCFRGPRHGYSL